MRKLALDDEILLTIEKPARYIGNEVNAVMKRPEIQQKVGAQGISVATYTPEQLAARMKEETTRWASVIKSRNLTMD